jgi:hypothetical protein
MRIRVSKWIKPLNVAFLNVTAVAHSDEVTMHEDLGSPGAIKQGPGQHALRDFSYPVTLGVPAGQEVARSVAQGRASRVTLSEFGDTTGDVDLYLMIEYQGDRPPPRSWSRVPAERVSRFETLPFQCSPEGDLKLKPTYKGVPKVSLTNRDLSMDIEVYRWRENPKRDVRVYDIPPEVFADWMKRIWILHIEMVVKLTLTQGGGWVSVSVKDGRAPAPVSGDMKGDFSTGENTATLGPLRIDLEPVGAAPPITRPEGFAWPVYFGVGSAEIDQIVEEPTGKRHQGKVLDTRIRDALSNHWDVRQALYYRKLKLRGEATASATWKDATPGDLVSKNQELSQKRLAAIVNRVNRIAAEQSSHVQGRPFVPDTSEMKAVGAFHATKLGDENLNDRVCTIEINGAELAKAIRDLYGRKLGGKNTMPPPPLPVRPH